MTNPNDLAEMLRLAQEQLRIAKELEAFNERVNEGFTGYLDAKKQLIALEKLILELEREKARLIEENGGHETEVTRQLEEQLKLQRQMLTAQRDAVRQVSFLVLAYKDITKYSMALAGGFITGMADFILDADKAWRSLALQMGISGKNSENLRDSLIQSSEYAGRLGVSFKELAEMQGSYTEEMGRAVLMTEQNFKYLTQVAKGTKMGTMEAGKMAAKFNLIGKSVKGVRDFYEDTVNQAERFGVSANDVIEKINSNLDKSQEFVFKEGTKGLAKMAMYASKFKMNMTSVFAAMEKSNSLEGSVDMAAQLQVIGGNFAKTDPFKLLYESRNDAVAFTKSMQGLTKGMYTFNKATGELSANAGDLNRLKLAAEATGQPFEDLIKQAKMATQIDMMGGMMGSLSKESKDFIESVAEIQKDGSFKVKIAPNTMKDIRSLSEGQVKSIMAANSTLEARAKESQAFDEILVNTINEMKSAILPILTVVGDATKWLSETELLKPIMWFGASVMALTAGLGFFGKTVGLFRTIFGGGASAGIFGKLGNLFKKGGSVGDVVQQQNTPNATPQITQMSGAAKAGALNMAAFGAAVALVGAGIWMATKGIAAMAQAFKGMKTNEIIGLNVSLAIMGVTMYALSTAMAAAAPGIGAGSTALLYFGGAVVAIGAGIGLAAAGIGYMAKGFGEMFDSLSQVTDPAIIRNLSGLILSLTGLSASLIFFANPLAWVGLAALGMTISSIGNSIKSMNFANVRTGAASFQSIATAIESINERKLDKLIAASEGLGAMGSISAVFSSLSNMFGQGMEVRFADDTVNLELNITNQIDSQPLTRALSRTIPLAIESARRGGQN